MKRKNAASDAQRDGYCQAPWLAGCRERIGKSHSVDGKTTALSR